MAAVRQRIVATNGDRDEMVDIGGGCAVMDADPAVPGPSRSADLLVGRAGFAGKRGVRPNGNHGDMEFEAAMEAIASFEGRAVCVDLIIARPAAGARAGLAQSSPGILRRAHPSERDEFWWTLPEAGYFECFPGSSLVVRKDRFRSAEWEGETLVIDTGAIVRHIVPLVRSDTLGPIQPLRAG